MTLPKHLESFFDTPVKRKKLDSMIKKIAIKERTKMRTLGYHLKGNQYIKNKK
jgi:hypothetical protein